MRTPPSPRTRVRRLPDRGAYDRATVDAILDEAFVCPVGFVPVPLPDGLVLARSVYHTSANYRSVVVLGVARLVDDEDEKRRALEALAEHLVPGRWADARQPNAKELKGTGGLPLPLA